MKAVKRPLGQAHMACTGAWALQAPCWSIPDYGAWHAPPSYMACCTEDSSMRLGIAAAVLDTAGTHACPLED